MLLSCHACTLVCRYRTTENLATPPHTLSRWRLEKEGTQFGTHVITKVHGVKSRKAVIMILKALDSQILFRLTEHYIQLQLAALLLVTLCKRTPRGRERGRIRGKNIV